MNEIKCIRSGEQVYEIKTKEKNTTCFIKYTYDIDKRISPNIDIQNETVCILLERQVCEGLQGQSYYDCIPGRYNLLHLIIPFSKLELLYESPDKIWEMFNHNK